MAWMLYLCVFDHACEDFLEAFLPAYVLPVNCRGLQVDVVHGGRSGDSQCLLHVLLGEELLSCGGRINTLLVESVAQNLLCIQHQVGQVVAVVSVRLLRHAVQTLLLLGRLNGGIEEVENLKTFRGSGDGESNILSESGPFLKFCRHVRHVV